MDSFMNQSSGFKPYNASPCPGCGQNAFPGQTGQMGQTGQRIPAAGTPTAVAPARTDVLGSQMPTGVPLGPQLGTPLIPQQGTIPQATGTMPSQELAPITPWTQPMPVTTESLQFMNGFMRTQIGRKVTVEFLIGTNTLIDKTGTLLAVGANYILINEVETDDILLCDFFSIKFMKFFY